MATLEDRAEGLALWAQDTPTDVVTAKMAELDRDALFWRIACMTLAREQIDRIEHMARHLIANGYTPPEA